MTNSDFNYMDEEMYQSSLGDAQVILITNAYTYKGQVYFDGVVVAPNFNAPYVFVRDACLRQLSELGELYNPSLLSWGGGDYYSTIDGLERAHNLDLSGYKSWYE